MSLSTSNSTLSTSAVAAPAATAAMCPHWITVMPLHAGREEEIARDVADQGNTTFIDGVAWSCSVIPEGDPVFDRAGGFAKVYRKTAPFLRGMSPVKQGFLLQATMGHSGFPGSPTPWQLYVKADGKSIYRMCPMGERFLSYIAGVCRTFAAEKPDFFMIDDDTRIVENGVFGCFCPLHLAAFAKRTGRDWTREEVLDLLKEGDSAEARTWEEMNVDSLRRFFRTIRENFGNEIPGILCTTSNRAQFKHAREFAQILAAPGQTPVIRGSGAPYHNRDFFHVEIMRSHYAAQKAVVGEDVIFLQESDTCPHTLWATSGVRTLDHLVMLALDGCKGAKIWITRTGNYHEKKSAEVYRRVFRENKGLMTWAADVEFVQGGVVLPPCGPEILNFGDRYFGLTGIPYRFGKARTGEITALTVETLALLPHDEIRAILSGAVVIDGPAAIWLTENGFSSDIGVKAKPWNRKTIQMHEFENGARQSGMRTDGLADLTDMAQGARVLTRLLNRPNMGAELAYEAPGTVLIDNERGGRILTLAQRIPEQTSPSNKVEYFSEGYRAAIIRWLTLLAGELPGGACYLGVGPVTCLSGTTTQGERIVVLNALDLDGDETPELLFGKDPASIERLQGNGDWNPVRFEKTSSGSFLLFSPILTQRPAIFRLTVEPLNR